MTGGGAPGTEVAAAERALATLRPSGQVERLFVPGRIEILGKHTDYAGGRSLTCAVERGFTVAFAPRPDPSLHIVDASDGRTVEFPWRRTWSRPWATGRTTR